ncbi:MAG: phosphate signaling complex protein PhoU [Sphaerochaeta sp.]|jgi:phosphate transport system protein|uniref:phosphate signaling complex protein PhoU n=1 Tax=Sphaerochaeta sp. TaxID=1972642 RepID=UPI003D12A042
MHSRLEEKLDLYKDLLIRMLKEVEQALLLSIQAVENRDQELAANIVQHDISINRLRDMAEHDGVMILVTEAPYAHYLRQAVAGLKITGEIERMGDYASHLAHVGASLIHTKEVDTIITLVCEMASSAVQMIKMVQKTLDEGQSDPARVVAKMDDDIDAKRYLINDLLGRTPASDESERRAFYACYYLTKEMERLGDHITNICEWMVYTVEGVRPKLN